MAQIFGPQANWIARVSLISIPVLLVLAVVVAEAIDRSGYVTGENVFVNQPVPFSHRHHVGDLQIDCRFCHRQVEKSAWATLPEAGVCMTCHAEIWAKAPMLEPVRQSAASGVPIRWNKVTALPEYVYFNHSIHIQKGIGCISCHGEVAKQPLTTLEHPMTMQFCVDCHRDPDKHLVAPDRRFDGLRKTNADTADVERLQKTLSEHYGVSARTDCYTCHR